MGSKGETLDGRPGLPLLSAPTNPFAVMWAGADVTSIKRAGRLTTFGFAIGGGLLIASGAGAAVAAAAPDGSGHASSGASSVSSGSASSARSARPSTSTAGKPKPARTASTRTDFSAPVIQLQTKRSPANAATASPTTENTISVPAAAKQAAPRRVPGLPTPAEFQQTITDGLGSVRRSLDDLRGKIETLVQNQIVGFQNSLLDLQIDLRRVFSNKPLIYGNPANSQYWVAQADETAYLMAAAMVINRLTGATVTADSLVTEAMATNSTTRPNRKMYLGPTTPDYVWPTDAYQLMENHGVSVTTTSYSRTQGRRALAALETALAEGKSVIVTINGPAVSLADPGQEEIGEHPVVVLAIDITNDVVYFNDGALPQGGQQRTMPLDTFIDTWRTSFYNATFAVAAPVVPQTASPATDAIAA
ncbi:hypothetical protein MycrhDRAFT_2208 [Mycolicibacterium rhodesiae JS60]|nr:hypothetical protein MycrhDRAFT_2208 [Mycolicibacterium rhodesiae JS60]